MFEQIEKLIFKIFSEREYLNIDKKKFLEVLRFISRRTWRIYWVSQNLFRRSISKANS